MIFGAKPGEMVVVWYAAKSRTFTPHHGRIGRILRVAKGRPRNIAVDFGTETVVVPAGNLRRVPLGDESILQVLRAG